MGRLNVNNVKNIQDVVITMAEGNPGALITCMGILEHAGKIDPDSALGSLGVIFDLDDMGIYGTDIYCLFKMICGGSFVKLIGLLRARQLGFISSNNIMGAIICERAGRSSVLNVDELIKKVKDHLPNFNINFS